LNKRFALVSAFISLPMSLERDRRAISLF